MFEIKPSKDFFTEIVNNIWNKQGELQRLALVEFAKTKRTCKVDELIKRKAFLVFSDLYLLNLIGDDICTPQYGLYKGGHCIFTGRLVIPIYGFDGRVHSFVGYDNGEEITTPEDKLKHVPYLYLSKDVFHKERYFSAGQDNFHLAYERQYALIVDGIFDEITLTSLGQPAFSLCSSNFTKYHRAYLRYVKYWVVVADNDEAGQLLLKRCRMYNKHTSQLIFKPNKDIDAFINTSEKNITRFNNAIQTMQDSGFLIDCEIV